MANNNTTENKRFIVKTPVEGQDGKTYWRGIGSAWLNAETDEHSESISIQLDALPLAGRLRAWPADEQEPSQG